MLKDNEIICNAQRVKYHSIEYYDKYITIQQNRTRRRVPIGYYFEDNGSEIYLSLYYSCLFQCKKKIRKFILNKETKEFRDFNPVTVENHIPELIIKDTEHDADLFR
jgi:hypothetical protein